MKRPKQKAIERVTSLVLGPRDNAYLDRYGHNYKCFAATVGPKRKAVQCRRSQSGENNTEKAAKQAFHWVRVTYQTLGTTFD